MVYVYMIQKGYGSIKIGVSANPEDRLAELQTGNHGELHLIAKFPFESRSMALTMEKELHVKFADSRLKGEWFKKRILREFKDRAKLFPSVFRADMPGKFNAYHSII